MPLYVSKVLSKERDNYSLRSMLFFKIHAKDKNSFIVEDGERKILYELYKQIPNSKDAFFKTTEIKK